MVFSHALVTLAECTAMAGENVDATGYVEANQQTWANQGSAYLCAISKYDWVTNIASVKTNVKPLLAEYIARYVGLSAIAYNQIGFVSPTGGSTTQVENMLNIHLSRMRAIEKILSNPDYIKYATS